MEKVNEYPGPYHWYQSRFQYARYYRQFELSNKYINSNNTILDVGCGDGKMTSLLSNISKTVYGIDNQGRALQFARLMTNKDNVKFKINNEKIPFKNNFFDVATCFDVIEHIPTNEVNNFLSEINRILKKKGIIIITTPNRSSLHNRIFGHKIALKHYYEYSLDELNSLLKSQSFHIKEKKGIYLQPILRFEKLANLPIFYSFFRILVNIGTIFPDYSEKLFVVGIKE